MFVRTLDFKPPTATVTRVSAAVWRDMSGSLCNEHCDDRAAWKGLKIT